MTGRECACTYVRTSRWTQRYIQCSEQWQRRLCHQTQPNRTAQETKLQCTHNTYALHYLSTASSSSHGMFVAPIMSSLSSLEVVAPSIWVMNSVFSLRDASCSDSYGEWEGECGRGWGRRAWGRKREECECVSVCEWMRVKVCVFACLLVNVGVSQWVSVWVRVCGAGGGVGGSLCVCCNSICFI